ncbi:hypothetical protein HKX48_006244 [Thoreauomyces humboldtii]|nr:hypothetical protein HKX48_006244 [Thoreauomyces humboldtii]
MVDYEQFLAQLRQKEVAPLMAHFKGFLVRFNSEKRPIMQHRKLVASFLHYIYGESLQNEVFALSSSDEELENIREGWEKLVMMNIYERVFGAPETDDLKMGGHLQRKIESFQWVQETHLDLPFSFHHTLEVAQAELLRVNGFRAPRDKLIILQNTAQIVVDLISKASSETAGNDHLLPALILTVIRANPPNLIANIKYIMRFRNQTELEKGTNQFCITNMMSAVSFIYNMTAKSLTLDEADSAKYGGQKDLPPRPSDFASGSGTGGGGSSSSSGGKDPVPQVSQLASKVYTSTSGWFNTLIKEAKIFGEQAAGKVDGFVNQVVGDSDDELQQQNPHHQANGDHHPNGPQRTHSGGNPYPGTIRTDGNAIRTERPERVQHLHPAGNQQQQPAPWMMQQSPGVSPLSPMPGMEDIAPPRPPRPAANMTPSEQEDYEMQLAMALSLSTIEADKQRREGGDEEGKLLLPESPARTQIKGQEQPHVGESEVKPYELAAGSSGAEAQESLIDADDVPLVRSKSPSPATSLPVSTKPEAAAGSEALAASGCSSGDAKVADPPVPAVDAVGGQSSESLI